MMGEISKFLGNIDPLHIAIQKGDERAKKALRRNGCMRCHCVVILL